MKILELFAGSCTFSLEAKKLGYETFTSDNQNLKDVDYVTDILDFDVAKIPFEPDLIWASPPCTAFSVLRIGENWHYDNTPKTPKACIGMAYVLKTVEIIKELKPKFWFIENPRGKLRKLNIVKNLPRTTVWYCKYGDHRAKPTDIWSNHIYNPMFNPQGWKPRPQCENGNIKCHHDKSPAGCGTTGVQGMSNNYDRSIIPNELCIDVLTHTLKPTRNVRR